MSQENLDIVREHLEAFCAKDWSRYRAALADDAIYLEKSTQRRAKGPEAIMQLVKGWADAFPDINAKITNAFAADESVVLEIEWDGTHKGTFAAPMGSIAPTGKHGKVEAVQVARLERGKIKEVHHYFDLMTLLQQMGVMPTKKAA